MTKKPMGSVKEKDYKYSAFSEDEVKNRLTPDVLNQLKLEHAFINRASQNRRLMEIVEVTLDRLYDTLGRDWIVGRIAADFREVFRSYMAEKYAIFLTAFQANTMVKDYLLKHKIFVLKVAPDKFKKYKWTKRDTLKSAYSDIDALKMARIFVDRAFIERNTIRLRDKQKQLMDALDEGQVT